MPVVAQHEIDDPHGVRPMRLRRIFCFLTQHQWSASGQCLRCGVECRHAISVYEPGNRDSHCIDCGAPVKGSMPNSENGRGLDQRPPRSLWQSIRHSVDHLFEGDDDH
jgi:hypothetical protein